MQRAQIIIIKDGDWNQQIYNTPITKFSNIFLSVRNGKIESERNWLLQRFSRMFTGTSSNISIITVSAFYVKHDNNQFRIWRENFNK